ncbi:MAG: alpha/beta hydrolase domain-containing protein [Thermodesulfobacteriota bacterium]|jgi:hypothetical protein
MKKLAYVAMAAVFLFSAVLVTNSLAWDQEGGPWHHKFCRNNSVPSPTVTRPTWTSDKIGDVSKNYPFFSPYADLADYGYIQEEFFIEGTANRYNTPALQTGSIIDGGHPYKTRIVVRRPVSPKDFNGTVLLEWQNVTAGYDLDAHWISWKHFMRAGYVWVGVSAQLVGVQAPVTGLKDWSPVRYGTLDVTAGGTIMNDSLCYDIFSQAAQAVRCPKGIDPMAGLDVKLVLAIGASQSASRLTIYFNSIHPLHNVVDGFYLLVGRFFGNVLRTDLSTKVFQVVSEFETKNGAYLRIPDSANRHTWEIAGAAHSGYDSYLYRKPIVLRDGIAPSSIACTHTPVFSRNPTFYALNAAYDHLVRWVKDGTPPPSAPLIQVSSVGGPTTPAVIVRDSYGNALGGLRLPAFEVPIGTNNGADNGGPSFCLLYGYFTPFDDATLHSLYPTHDAYVHAFKHATYEALKAGYIVKEDADEMIAEAIRAEIP